MTLVKRIFVVWDNCVASDLYMCLKYCLTWLAGAVHRHYESKRRTVLDALPARKSQVIANKANAKRQSFRTRVKVIIYIMRMIPFLNPAVSSKIKSCLLRRRASSLARAIFSIHDWREWNGGRSSNTASVNMDIRKYVVCMVIIVKFPIILKEWNIVGYNLCELNILYRVTGIEECPGSANWK